jgi:hypothetical protein
MRPDGSRVFEAVHGPAAVGVDQPAHELPRVGVDDLALPWRQDDRALVLASAPHLREEVRPVLRPRCDAHRAIHGVRVRARV